jgi:hypothetical protein
MPLPQYSISAMFEDSKGSKGSKPCLRKVKVLKVLKHLKKNSEPYSERLMFLKYT